MCKGSELTFAVPRPCALTTVEARTDAAAEAALSALGVPAKSPSIKK